ncbi:hypothetical protein JCM8097_009532 [Rhodosporidiobolus ruineniae]
MSSWLPVDPSSHFSPNNIPFGIVSHPGSGGKRVAATRIGEHVVDLSVLEAERLLATAFGWAEEEQQRRVFSEPTLNAFAALAAKTRSAVRLAVQELLSSASTRLRDDQDLRTRAVFALSSVETHLPLRIPDFVDYSVFPDHGLGASEAIFGKRELPPSWNTLPMAYNGRASTVSVKEEIVRPQGQTRAFSAAREVGVGESKALDWEFEIGAFVAESTTDGEILTPETAASRIFGFVLLNDWSARDIQGFEMVPLGPFNGKSFATTISPWVVLPDALEPFRTGKPALLEGTPFQQAEYLREDPSTKNNYAIECKTSLALSSDPTVHHEISRASFAAAFWSFPQLLAYQTFSGTPINTGDLLGSGTISNEPPSARGCMLEMGKGGKSPIRVGEEERGWIQDGDEVVFSAWAGEEGARVGFGELKGKVLPASNLRLAK